MFWCCKLEKFWLYIGIFEEFCGLFCSGVNEFVFLGEVVLCVELYIFGSWVEFEWDGSKFIEGIVIVLWSGLWEFDVLGVFCNFVVLVINGWCVKFLVELYVGRFIYGKFLMGEFGIFFNVVFFCMFWICFCCFVNIWVVFDILCKWIVLFFLSCCSLRFSFVWWILFFFRVDVLFVEVILFLEW